MSTKRPESTAPPPDSMGGNGGIDDGLGTSSAGPALTNGLLQRVCAVGQEPVRYVRQAPSTCGPMVPIDIRPLDLTLVGRWQSHVQPVIDKMSDRTDHGWRWRRIWATTHLVGALQAPNGFAACVSSREGDPFPCAMVQLVGRFPALDDQRNNSVFLWYLADAPENALVDNLGEARIPKMLGTIALDIAVTFSFNMGLDGRTGLHADAAGGSKLAAWYASKGMASLPAHVRPSVFRRNDGRYFYHTPLTATAASQKLDRFR